MLGVQLTSKLECSPLNLNRNPNLNPAICPLLQLQLAIKKPGQIDQLRANQQITYCKPQVVW